MSRVRMTVAYHGAPFHGFAANVGVVTVAGTISDALERVLGHPVVLTGAGRTDRGVHARGQVVSFDADTERMGALGSTGLRRALNGICAPSIVVREVAEVEPDFDARFSARSRVYRYTVLNSPVPDPFAADTSWWLESPLDLDRMSAACAAVVGEHDFSSFCRRPRTRPPQEPVSLVRQVSSAGWRDLGGGFLEFEIEARSFCHQMVRSLTGTLVEIGMGRRAASDMGAVLAARDRAAAGRLAPPHGLCLWEVRF